jgi:hypothetical protein
MKINDDLKLVLPLREDAKGVQVYAYHTPISREIFEANYRLLAATKAELLVKGMPYFMGVGPTIATLALMDEAKKDSIALNNLDHEGKPDCRTAKALLEDLKRLTVVLVPTENGYKDMPIDAAISSKKIDMEEWLEVQANIVFFTCCYSLVKNSDKQAIAISAASHMMGLVTSSAPMEFINSLPTSTTEETSESKTAS